MEDIYCDARFKEYSDTEMEYFTMRVDEGTSEVTGVGKARYTIGKGFYDRVEKHPNEEGFEELLCEVFRAIVEMSWQLTPLKDHHPDLFKTLYEKHIK